MSYQPKVGAALGLGAKKDKINAIANIVNSKVPQIQNQLFLLTLHLTYFRWVCMLYQSTSFFYIFQVGLLNLKTNVVRAGIEGAGLVNSCKYPVMAYFNLS